MFTLSTKRVFEDSIASDPLVQGVAIMEDFYMLRKTEKVLKAYENFGALCKADGSLELNPAEGTLMHFHMDGLATIDADTPIWPWLVRYAAQTLHCFQIGKDNKSPRY